MKLSQLFEFSCLFVVVEFRNSNAVLTDIKTKHECTRCEMCVTFQSTDLIAVTCVTSRFHAWLIRENYFTYKTTATVASYFYCIHSRLTILKTSQKTRKNVLGLLHRTRLDITITYLSSAILRVQSLCNESLPRVSLRSTFSPLCLLYSLIFPMIRTVCEYDDVSERHTSTDIE